jgi:coproporphyrinogen III oxidase-like Fe-S oxidoreductase
MRELQHLYLLEGDALIEALTSRTIRVTPAGRIFIRAVAKVFDSFSSTGALASRAV